MSLVSNIINNVSPLQQGGKFGSVSGIDVNDNTFSNLLEKSLNTKIEDSQNDFGKYWGIPAGFDIQELKIDNNSIPHEKNKINEELLDFAKKQAANSYYKYSGSVITDLTEFVEDALNIGS